jgi:aspartate kinase
MSFQVFKFGGASIKDAAAIRNVADIIECHKTKDLIIVVSAIGKTTNALEKIIDSYLKSDESWKEQVQELIKLHYAIIDGLSQDKDFISTSLQEISKVQYQIFSFINTNKNKEYNYVYDQLVSKGEELSRAILYQYLKLINLNFVEINPRDIIKTDMNYTDANILWSKTESAVKSILKPKKNYITSGFLGGDKNGNTTTLGREGSDYSASILSYCISAEKMVVWKDVKGVYNADPNKFKDAIIIPFLSYKEAIEMTFYGAQVIHPKTIKPLQNKSIPMEVRSFIKYKEEGTLLSDSDNEITYPPVIVHKGDQVMLEFANRDFAFLNEKNLGSIIETFGAHSLRINLMQNTAISFVVCTDFKFGKIDAVISELTKNFEIKKTESLTLLTIRHHDEKTEKKLSKNQKVLLVQRSEDTVQMLCV